MRNPYESLAVPRTASADDIKKSFRQLAKKLHPDTNTCDPNAAALFAELNAAHAILSDEAKRRAFDRGQIDAEGKPSRQMAATRFRRYGMGPVATRLMIVVLMLAATSTLVIARLTPQFTINAGSEQQPELGPAEPGPQLDGTFASAATTATLRQDATDQAALPQLDHRQIGLLLARSWKAMSEGDVEAARTLLERAAKSHDPRAALALGSTYDPNMLAILGARGVEPDAFLARIWYRRAIAFGSEEAKKTAGSTRRRPPLHQPPGRAESLFASWKTGRATVSPPPVRLSGVN
jgi:curved DNA-binding protein CbpA